MNYQILKAVRDKVSRLLKIDLGEDNGFFDECEWMIECAENNAYYGYGVDTLLTIRMAADYLLAAERTGVKAEITEFIRLLGRIGRAICSGDKEYQWKQWCALNEWANK